MAALACSFPLQCIKNSSNPQSHLEFASLQSNIKSKETGVVDFTQPSKVYENVKQATSFGMRSEVYVPGIKVDTEGWLVNPTQSIGSILLQRVAISASSHYCNVETDVPSSDASQIANNLSNLGQNCNREDISTGDWNTSPWVSKAMRAYAHSGQYHTIVEVYTLKHDVTNVQCLIPGLLLAIRKVVRLENLVYGWEKIL
ncbi:Dihydrodipicolinate reductase-like protein CRR1, chloroplastic, partial [Cucurbita argyrosperma subsp. argyrosperma]